MSSLPGGDSVGMVLRMPYNSSTRATVCLSSALIFFGNSSCKFGVPCVRMEDAMEISPLFKGNVTVWMAFGVGGANPPVIPIKKGCLLKNDLGVRLIEKRRMYHSEVLTNIH